MNILLVTLDQFRGDSYGAAGHPLVKTPTLDALCDEGVRLARHYSQCAPCSPGRASLYTGMYQANHRVVANGTPLDSRFDNIALAARRAGYRPALFGYTDQAIDPRVTSGPRDPRLENYEGILPGFEEGFPLAEHDAHHWLAWLERQGHERPATYGEGLGSEPTRPAEHSASAFLADRFIDWLQGQSRPWFAHLSQLRPHPPFRAAGHFSRMYAPEDTPAAIAPEARHPLHEQLMGTRGYGITGGEDRVQRMRAQYYGMVSEADFQLGRVFDAIRARGQWDDTLIVVTSDHGEQLGDHGLVQKSGFYEQSYHILGIVRDPGKPQAFGTTVERFTENIDIFPTLCEAMGVPVPAQCDGLPLTPFLDGATPPRWRDAAHWEWDWRALHMREEETAWPWDRRAEERSLAVHRTEDAAYVHFADGSWLAFDLAKDPTWRTPLADERRVLELAQGLLTWRQRQADRTMTGMLVEDGGVGRWPTMPATWGR